MYPATAVLSLALLASTVCSAQQPFGENALFLSRKSWYCWERKNELNTFSAQEMCCSCRTGRWAGWAASAFAFPGIPQAFPQCGDRWQWCPACASTKGFDLWVGSWLVLVLVLIICKLEVGYYKMMVGILSYSRFRLKYLPSKSNSKLLLLPVKRIVTHAYMAHSIQCHCCL